VITKTHSRGFTLVEILVSLAILSVILGALIQSAGASASNAARLRDRAVAEWVASNRLAEMQIAREFARIGSKSGDEEVFGVKWYWKSIVQAVEDENLRRVDIEVRRAADATNPQNIVASAVLRWSSSSLPQRFWRLWAVWLMPDGLTLSG